MTLLRTFISDRGKIRARRVTGLTPQQQRRVAVAIRNAREMALLPYPRGARLGRSSTADPPPALIHRACVDPTVSCPVSSWRPELCSIAQACRRISGRRLAAPLAQSAERLHGKEKVYGSIP